jgi:hypothetical protein
LPRLYNTVSGGAEENLGNNFQAIINYTSSKGTGEEMKRFVDHMGETIAKKLNEYASKNIEYNKKLLKRKTKKSSKEEKSKFYEQAVNENKNDNDAFLLNIKADMFDETNSLSACMLSSPPMTPTRFDENIFQDLFINNSCQFDSYYDSCSCKYEEFNSLMENNNIYNV